jgi:hypothetical protein
MGASHPRKKKGEIKPHAGNRVASLFGYLTLAVE